ncbi:DUF421 domain-containing protein [Alkalibacillus aidingensis]|uniref:DUF421 domain-containing protein n=1 Tax=Alkalibacillus aidingensis TaxID=2747607 RepID=UPI0016612B47|nr:DUF421 domain-containing protein [Alkalibacillus aidingensis]
MELTELIIRITVAFVILFILARIMGRKEISQMTFFNFVSAISIGSITASLAVDSSLSIRNGIIALMGWTIFTLLMGYIDIKSKKARKITTGEPIIVIKDGKIMENSLQSTRLDIDSLTTLLRQKGVFSIKDVDYAVFETSGQLSVLKKDLRQSVTKEDLNIAIKEKVYPAATEVITDGLINKNNLKRLNLDHKWLLKQLENKGIQTIDQVFYGEIQQDGSLYIDKKDDRMTN